MIPRSAEPALKALAGQFPAVILLGPRQCGKTTPVRHFVGARYFDLERPSDLQVFAGDFEYALQNLKEPLILDEAQTLPALFPVLRSVIDEARRKNGRFFLLGSVNPDLLTNISESLAGRVGSYHTIQSIIDLFIGYFLIRRLQPYHANVKKRLVKAPKVYLRDSGILHYLLGIGTADQLLTSPARGNSFEGFMIQQIAALEELQHSGSAFYFFRTHSGAEIDLLIDRGSHRVGFEFKAGVATDAVDWKHLQAGIDDGVIHRGYVVYNGTREFPVSDKISVIPATQILSGRLD